MRFYTFLILLLWTTSGYSQVGINTPNPHVSAALEIQSGTGPKGILIPRMTTL